MASIRITDNGTEIDEGESLYDEALNNLCPLGLLGEEFANAARIGHQCGVPGARTLQQAAASFWWWLRYRLGYGQDHLQTIFSGDPDVNGNGLILGQGFYGRKVSKSGEKNCLACGVLYQAANHLWRDTDGRDAPKYCAYYFGQEVLETGRHPDTLDWKGNVVLASVRVLDPKDENENESRHVVLFTKPGDQLLKIQISRHGGFQADPAMYMHLPVRKLVGSNHSYEAIDWARQCISRCDHLHQKCGVGTDPPKLPTRVLDLGSDIAQPTLRLYETGGVSARYVCLSHCWGKARNPHLTTTKTLEANKSSIPLNELPQTMQDAVVITRKFDIRYLWIDSLCIIQDSEEDWAHEAAQMASIYENGFLTIGATSAKSDDEGFLSQPMEYVRLYAKTSEGKYQDIYVQEDPNPPMPNSTSEPLFTRAWCYQERMLCPRILHFSREELWWECREENLCQCRRSNHHVPADKARFYLDTNEGWHWRRAVREYTKLHLSFDKDLLPALSGVAQRVAAWRGGDRYLAGLWESSLYEDLCWKPYRVGRVPQDWRAPTWSWASFNNWIEWDTLESQSSFDRDAQIVACEAEPNSEDPFGGVEFGILIIRGKLSPCKVGRGNVLGVPDISRHHLEGFGLDMRLPKSSAKPEMLEFKFYPDAHPYLAYALNDKPVELMKLRMFHRADRSAGVWECFYLILRRSLTEDVTYERQGCASIFFRMESDALPTFLEGEQEERVVII